MHGPQPVPQDPNKTPEQTQATTHTASDAPQLPPTADSPRPSQPPADDMLPDAQASHPPSQPPSHPPEGEAKEPRGQGVGEAPQGGRAPQPGSREDVCGKRQLLREHVVHVTEAAACLPGLASSEAECKKVPICRFQKGPSQSYCPFHLRLPLSNSILPLCQAFIKAHMKCCMHICLEAVAACMQLCYGVTQHCD